MEVGKAERQKKIVGAAFFNTYTEVHPLLLPMSFYLIFTQLRTKM